MRTAELPVGLFAFSESSGFWETAIDGAVWMVTGYSNVLGLALATALFRTRNRIALSDRKQIPMRDPAGVLAQTMSADSFTSNVNT
jgi:hypothetical protein